MVVSRSAGVIAREVRAKPDSASTPRSGDASSETRVLGRIAGHRPDLTAALGNFADGTRNYMVASATFGLVVAVIGTVALWLMGVPGALVWGVLAFVTNFIPNIGF